MSDANSVYICAALAYDELDPTGFVPTRFLRGLSGELDEDTLFAVGNGHLIQCCCITT